MATARYDADEIQVLEGLAPVRVRPAMYIGSTDSQGLEHMLLEVVSNSIDEHISNHADQLSVSFDDEAVVVEDNGRGIPVEIMPRHGSSVLERILNYATLTEGSHVAGVLEGIERAFPGRLSTLRPRVVAAVHLGLLHPDFEGPTRAVLHVPEVQQRIADVLAESLSAAGDARITWLEAAASR